KVVATDGVFTQSVDTSFSVEDFSLSASMLTLSTLPTATTSFFLSSSTIINNSQPIAITCTTSNPAVQCQLPGPTLSVGLGEQVNVITRSEEHTSELQSPDHLGCRLPLEKKKKNYRQSKTDNNI